MHTFRKQRLFQLFFLILASGTPVLSETDSTHTLEDITVKGVIAEPEKMTRSEEIGKLEISSEEIMKLPSMGEADIARALKLVPGVSVGNENSAQLIVQGGAPEQNLTLLDGIPIYSVDHFFGFFSPFNADAVEKVTIYKNYFPGEYGSRISSIQSYTGTVADQDQFKAGARIGLLSGSFHMGSPIGERFSLFIAGRRSFTDFLQTPLYNEIFSQFDKNEDLEHEFNTGEINRKPVFNYADLNAKLRYSHKKDVAEISLYWSRDELSVDSKVSIIREDVNIAHPKIAPVWVDQHNHRTISTDADWGNLGSAGRWERRWNSSVTTELRAGFSSYFLTSNEHHDSRQQYDLKAGLKDVSTKRLDKENKNNVEELFGEIQAEFWLSDWNQLKAGVHGQLYSTKYSQSDKFHYLTYLNPNSVNTLYYPPYTIDDTLKLTDTDISEGAGSAWIHDNITLGDKFFASVAGRFTYYQGTGKSYFSPRFSLAYDPVSYLRLKAGGGRYYQYVSRAEMEDNYLEGARYFWILADKNAAPVASSDQISAGFSLTPWELLFDVETYFKRQNNITMYSRSFTPEINSYLSGEGTICGIDFMLQKKIRAYSGWISYTLSEAVMQYGDEVNNGKPFYSPYDRPHELKVVNNFEKGGFNASLTWIYASGTPYSVPVGHDSLRVFNRNYFDVKRSVWSAKNSHRLPDYHRLDLSVSYKFTPSDRFDITVGGSVFNLYNHKNIRGYEYRYIVDDNGTSWYNDRISRIESHYMGITPSLFLAANLKKWRN